MATFTSENAARGGLNPASCQAGEIRAVRGVVTVPVTHAVNDIIELVKLPAQHVMVDCILECADLDSGTAIVLDVGITDDPDGATEDPNALIAASAVGQAGGLARMDAVEGLAIAAVDNNRIVGVTIATGATTELAGDVALTLFYRGKLTGEA